MEKQKLDRQPLPLGVAMAYGVKEAAQVVGLSRSRLYELIAEGRVDARKVGGRTLIPAESLQALVADAPAKEAA
jgi:excisionase family DNA binding protein